MKKTLLSLAVCASLAFGMEDRTNLEITEADVKEINQMAVPEKIEKQESKDKEEQQNILNQLF